MHQVLNNSQEPQFTLLTATDADTVLHFDMHPVVSYGERVDVDDITRRPEGDEITEFYGVYVHDVKGHAQWVADVFDEVEALVVGRELVKSWIYDQLVVPAITENELKNLALIPALAAKAKALIDDHIGVVRLSSGDPTPHDPTADAADSLLAPH